MATEAEIEAIASEVTASLSSRSQIPTFSSRPGGLTLAQAYRVYSVPKTVINGMAELNGALPEEAFFQRVLTAIGREDLLQVARVSEPQGPVNAPSTLLTQGQQGRSPQQGPAGSRLI